MLGHGESAPVTDMTAHSMPAYGADVIALLDHLGVAQAVIGGTSLGANVALEAAAAAPERVRALFLEMPVLENGLAGAAALFVPLALALRVSQRSMQRVAAMARRIPRSHFLVDVLIDFARRDPATSLAILDGLTFGRTAPPADSAAAAAPGAGGRPPQRSDPPVLRRRSHGARAGARAAGVGDVDVRVAPAAVAPRHRAVRVPARGVERAAAGGGRAGRGRRVIPAGDLRRRR
jgi:pimeloyl-ACP methyl ester carboxylesterase